MPSTVSPKNSMRTARVSSYAGNTSTTSPRTRNVPRWKSMSFRSVLDLDEFPEYRVPVAFLIADEVDEHIVVRLRRSEAVNARNRGNNNDVLPFQEGPGGRMPHFVDGFVDARVFFHERIALRDVRFRLIVVVVRRRNIPPHCGERGS